MEKKIWNLYCDVHYAEDLYPHEEHMGCFFGTEEEIKAYVDAENSISSAYDSSSTYGKLSYRAAGEAKVIPAPKKAEDTFIHVSGSWQKRYRMYADDDYGWYIHIWSQSVGSNSKVDTSEVKYDNSFNEPEVTFYLRGISGETHKEFLARAKARTEELLPAPEGKKLGEPEEV